MSRPGGDMYREGTEPHYARAPEVPRRIRNTNGARLCIGSHRAATRLQRVRDKMVNRQRWTTITLINDN
jgi:hypothetical protein